MGRWEYWVVGLTVLAVIAWKAIGPDLLRWRRRKPRGPR